jgi:hypothetical protein
MILKECAPSPAREETKKEGSPFDSASYNINLSIDIEEAKKQIARELLSRPRHSSMPALNLVCYLTHSIDESVIFARAIHDLGRRSLVTLKGNFIKANRWTESVLEDKHD